MAWNKQERHAPRTASEERPTAALRRAFRWERRENMEIVIVYQTWNDKSPLRLTLTPEEYFDPIQPGETFEQDAIPKFNHTWQYLRVPRDSLKWSMEHRSGTSDDTVFLTQYMDGGRSWMNHRSDPNGYEEIVQCTQLDECRCHIIRAVKIAPNGRWAVSYNGLITDQDDGSQAEQRFDVPWSFDDIKAFSHLSRTFIPTEPGIPT